MSSYQSTLPFRVAQIFCHALCWLMSKQLSLMTVLPAEKSVTGNFSEHIIHYQYFSRRELEGSSQTYLEVRKSLLDQKHMSFFRSSENNCFHLVLSSYHFSKENGFSRIINPQFLFCLLYQQTHACLLYINIQFWGYRGLNRSVKSTVSNYLCQLVIWLFLPSTCSLALSDFAIFFFF